MAGKVKVAGKEKASSCIFIQNKSRVGGGVVKTSDCAAGGVKIYR